MNLNAPEPTYHVEPFFCERCGFFVEDPEDGYWEFRHGALWCGACCNCEDVGEHGYEQMQEEGREADRL